MTASATFASVAGYTAIIRPFRIDIPEDALRSLSGNYHTQVPQPIFASNGCRPARTPASRFGERGVGRSSRETEDWRRDRGFAPLRSAAKEGP